MKKQAIRDLIEGQESQKVEFKSRVSSFGADICAFANTNDGVILFGVTDEGRITGIQRGDEEVIANVASDCNPPIRPAIELVTINDKAILVAQVSLTGQLHGFGGRVYLRVGSTNRALSPSEILKLGQRRGKVSFGEQICRGASLDDIDQDKVQWYLAVREEIRQTSRPKDLSLAEVLVNIGAAIAESGNPRPTDAGVLFFGRNPQRFFVQARLRLVRFRGTRLTNPVTDRFDTSGSLWEMVNQGEDFLRKSVRLLSRRTESGFRREDKFEYPIRALREAVINALIHRDYFETADVRVMVFDDRIEVVNPGTFPEGVTPDRPEHKPVNPLLCVLMYDVGYIEKYGSGIYMMNELCREWGNEIPCYEFGSTQTKLIFKSPVGEITEVEVEGVELNERQKKALGYIKGRGQITNKEYRNLFDVVNNTAYRDLTDLVNKGLIEKQGSGRSTLYVLSSNEKSNEKSNE